MIARLQRLGRYYEGKPVLVWCFPLQELPKGVRVGGDGDWAPTTELPRRSTSGGAVRYGLHTWDCYSVTQATIAPSSGLQCKVYLSEMRFLVKGLSSLMVAGFFVHCASADVEAVSGETVLNAVNPVTDSQDWRSIPTVSLVLLLATLLSFRLDYCCDWFSVVCRAWFGHEEGE